MMYILQSGEIIKVKKQVTIGGTTYPPQMLDNQELRESLGIRKYELVKESFDSRYYWEGQTVRTETDTTVTDTITRGEPRLVDDRLEVNEDGTPMLDQDGNQVVTRGLKYSMKEKVKAQTGNEILAKYPEWKQRNLLAEYIELLNKKIDLGLSLEEATYMDSLKAKYDDINAMRVASDAKEAEIDALVDIDAVIAYEQAN